MTDLLQTRRPPGGFRVVYADPPWGFVTYGGDQVVFTAGSEQPYQTMSHEQLLRLPVRYLVARDAILIMWVVDAHLLQAIELAEAWGFEFCTRAFTWDKGVMRGGYWIRKESEVSWQFNRGNPTRLSAAVRDMIREKPREHSRKPDCVYPRIERLARGPYLELFSRSNRPGWTSWGNQTGLFGTAGDGVERLGALSAG